MKQSLSNWALKPVLALAVAVPLYGAAAVSDADAGHRSRTAAIIAGAIIGGAIIYNHHRYRKYKRRHYVRHHHHGHRHAHRNRYGRLYYHSH